MTNGNRGDLGRRRNGYSNMDQDPDMPPRGAEEPGALLTDWADGDDNGSRQQCCSTGFNWHCIGLGTRTGRNFSTVWLVPSIGTSSAVQHARKSTATMAGDFSSRWQLRHQLVEREMAQWHRQWQRRCERPTCFGPPSRNGINDPYLT
jgi:hypothetical protein